MVDALTLAELEPHWCDLIGRADVCNVFLHPALVRTAAQSYAAETIRACLAWMRVGGGRQLVGVWAFATARPRQSVLPAIVLNSPPFPNAYLATPVLDRRLLDEAWSAMLDRLAEDPALPKLAVLEAMSIDEATMAALARVLAARHSRMWLMASAPRPKLASDLDPKQYFEQALSSSSRKKLRQHRNRLAKQGRLAHAIARDPASIDGALEKFLQLEAKGWKGRNGTALLCNPRDAAFARAAVGVLAREGCASMHTLSLDARPLSMQIILQCGAAAFTWKTAFDEEFSDFSPGMLLFEDYTAALLADPGVAYVDSCAYDSDSFMAAWTESQCIGNVWFDVRAGGSLRTEILACAQMGYRALRDIAKERSAMIRRAWRR